MALFFCSKTLYFAFFVAYLWGNFWKQGVQNSDFSPYYERTFSEMPFSCSWDSEEQDCNTGYTPYSCSLAILLFWNSTPTKAYFFSAYNEEPLKRTPAKEQINLRIMRELYGKPGPNSKLVSIEQWEERLRRILPTYGRWLLKMQIPSTDIWRMPLTKHSFFCVFWKNIVLMTMG